MYKQNWLTTRFEVIHNSLNPQVNKKAVTCLIQWVFIGNNSLSPENVRHELQLAFGESSIWMSNQLNGGGEISWSDSSK